MRTPRFMASLAGSQVGVEHADVALAKFALHSCAFLKALCPTSGHADDKENGDVASRQHGTRQHGADPVRYDGPNRRHGVRLCAFNSLPNLFLKARRERSVGAPFPEHFAEWLVVVAWIGGLHVTSRWAAEVAAAHHSLL